MAVARKELRIFDRDDRPARRRNGDADQEEVKSFFFSLPAEEATVLAFLPIVFCKYRYVV